MFSPLTKELIEALSTLPGIGSKSAQRLAFYLLHPHSKIKGLRLSDAINKAITQIKPCQRCRLYTEETICVICKNPKRDQHTLCVVESPADMVAIESAQTYFGLYFMLSGHLSPLDGIGPEQIGIPDLLKTLKENDINEVILATNSTVEGRATAHYIASHVDQRKMRCSRIAHGVPMGGELEYLDGVTLHHAFKSRILVTDA